MPHPTSLIDEFIKNKIILKDLKKKNKLKCIEFYKRFLKSPKNFVVCKNYN